MIRPRKFLRDHGVRHWSFNGIVLQVQFASEAHLRAAAYEMDCHNWAFDIYFAASWTELVTAVFHSRTNRLKIRRIEI